MEQATPRVQTLLAPVYHWTDPWHLAHGGIVPLPIHPVQIPILISSLILLHFIYRIRSNSLYNVVFFFLSTGKSCSWQLQLVSPLPSYDDLLCTSGKV
jgi:hypothetical protein